MIGAGILLIISALSSFVGVFIDSRLAIVVHIIKLIIGAVGIVFLFKFGAPIWMSILAIVSVLAGFIGGSIATASEEGSILTFTMVVGGIVCNIVIGVLCFF